MGKTPYRAAMEAADEIGLAVIAITVTIIAVFSPVSFMGGIAGQYFKQFGLTVAVAVFFSLLVARLITPMLAAYFFHAHATEGPGFGRLLRRRLMLLGPLARLAIGVLFAIAASCPISADGFVATLGPYTTMLPPLTYERAMELSLSIGGGAIIVAALLAFSPCRTGSSSATASSCAPIPASCARPCAGAG